MQIKGKSESEIIWFYQMIFIVMLTGIFLWGAVKLYGPVLFPDEFGYWGNAAELLGYEWSKVMAAAGGYYSFGYSLLLMPLMKLIKDPILLYRVATGINFCLIAVSFCLLFEILKKLFADVNKKKLILISSIGICYPSVIYYMHLTLTESLLTFLFLLVVYLLILFIEKPNCLRCILLISAVSYLYFSHMRTVGILLACLSVTALFSVKKGKYRYFMITVLVVIILMLTGVLVKEDLLKNLYSAVETTQLAENQFGGQVEKIKVLFTYQGLRHFMMSCIGKLFYLGSTTYGLIYWAFALLIKKSLIFIKESVRNKGNLKDGKNLKTGENSKEHIVYLFLLLSVSAAFFISAIFMMFPKRIDTLIYGRYNEIFVPIMMALGMISLLKGKRIFRKSIAVFAVQVIFAAGIYAYIKATGMTSYHECFVSGFAYAKAVQGQSVNLQKLLITVCLCSGFINLLLAGAASFRRKCLKYDRCMPFLIVIQIYMALAASYNNNYEAQKINYYDVELAKIVTDIYVDNQDIVFINSNFASANIEGLQYFIRDIPIQYKKESKVYDASDIIITYYDNPLKEELQKQYNTMTESGHFNMFYNL